MSVSLLTREIPADKWVEVICPATVEINYQVSNGVVLWQRAMGGAGAGGRDYANDPAELWPGPGSVRRRCDAIRFKSKRADQLAVVSIEALTGTDLGEPL